MRLPLALAALLAVPTAGRAEDPAAAATVVQADAAAKAAVVQADAAAAAAAAQADAAAAAAAAQADAAAAAALGHAQAAAAPPQQTTLAPVQPGPSPAVPQAAPVPAPTMTDEAAAALGAAAATDAGDAKAAGLPLPAELAQQGAAAQAALEANRARRILPRWGLALGGGFPDFATASVVFRPVSHVRLSAGPSWNYIGWGLHGGVALVPWNWAITPVISLEGGRFFRSDASFLLDDADEDADRIRPLLQGIDYAYGALDVGFEVGSPRGFSFSFRVGVSHVRVVANGSATYTSDDDGSGATTVTIRDPRFSGTLPSVKTGFQYWF
jgi:hypothetical protein